MRDASPITTTVLRDLDIAETSAARDAKAGAARAFWRGQLYSWRWISSAISLVGLLAFTLTGVTPRRPDQG